MPKKPPKAAIALPVPDDLQGSLSPKTLAYQSPQGKLWRSDALELLGDLASGSVDLVVSDPPYAIGKDSWDRFPSMEAYVDWCDLWLTEVERVLSPKGTAYVCGFSEILAEIKARSAKRFAGCRWLVWYYKNKANLGSDWGRSHESILHLRKSSKTKLHMDEVRIPYNSHTKRYPVRTQSESSQYSKARAGEKWQPHPLGAKARDVLEIPVLCNGTSERTSHPTQKPEELIRRMIAGSSAVNELVVDPFCGSGTSAVVAERLGRNWICGDADARYVGMARQRLQRAIESPDLAGQDGGAPAPRTLDASYSDAGDL